jgi:hypothetical protein
VQHQEVFIQPGEEHLVCRLHKPLYGLKKSPWKWNEKFDSFIIQFGPSRSTADQCIYFPTDPHSRLVRVPSTDHLEDNPDLTHYRALVGGLFYVMGMTSPDIAFAVIAVSRHCHSPGKPHWKAAKTILTYLAGTPNHGLCFSVNKSTNHLVGYSDADYAGCPDTRRSTTGLVFS